MSAKIFLKEWESIENSRLKRKFKNIAKQLLMEETFENINGKIR